MLSVQSSVLLGITSVQTMKSLYDVRRSGCRALLIMFAFAPLASWLTRLKSLHPGCYNIYFDKFDFDRPNSFLIHVTGSV
jgi:hypothetical protein